MSDKRIGGGLYDLRVIVPLCDQLETKLRSQQRKANERRRAASARFDQLNVN
jgi:hypothetical protein